MLQSLKLPSPELRGCLGLILHADDRRFLCGLWITLSAVSARESRALVVDSFVSAPSVWFAADGGTVVVSATMDVCAEESWAEPDAVEPSLWLSPFTETVSPPGR